MAHRSLVFSFLLTLLLLLSEVLGNWGFLAKPVEAASAGVRPSAPASMTVQKFLKEGRNDQVYHGPLMRPQKAPTLPAATRGHGTNTANLPPSAEPATMKAMTQSLAPTFLQGSAGLKSLDLRGSDGRLEVLIAPGAFDLSKATVAGGSAPQGSITLRLSQLSGHFVGMLSQLGTYQVQLLDSQGKVLNGIQLRSPITFIYHYQTAELASLGLDPGHLFLTWPALLAAAQKRHAPTTGYSIPLSNNAAAHTLTGQSSVLGSQIVNLGAGDPGNQSPPALHLASVQGNAGQLTYSYPLQLAPGSEGFTPQLALTYSSSIPNGRHSLTSPANNMGDGWNLSLGSISTEISGSTTWYFLNDAHNTGDRLVPIGTTNFFDTQHISYLKIQIVNPTSSTPCFHLWDKLGAYYEMGCTADSLEYWTDSGGGRHNYRWNVKKIVAPNEGASAGTYKMILVKYLQDSVTSGGYTTIRDSAIEQITYGIATSLSNPLSTIAGTVDFHYLAPTAQGSWADAYNYGTNYNCAPGTTQPAGHPGNLRCDDPVQESGSGTFTAPTVLSTLTLAYVTSYVGDDSSNSHQDYRYAFTYNDYPYVSCTDPTSGLAGYCAGDHLLMSATPTVYQNGTAHQLKGMVFGYTTGQQDTYTDLSQTVGGQPYQVTTSWQYLNSYRDTNTGVGAKITYTVAYNNTHGTPTQKDGSGNIVDDRYDPFYCVNHQGDPTLGCNGNWAHPDDRAWSEQVVTRIKAWSLDSSSSSLQQALTHYSYRLAKTGTYSGTGTFCSPDQYNQDQDCVGDNWIPAGDTDWQDYYHAEYQGFAQVYITSPASDLTVDSYYDTEGWGSPWSDPQNFLGGSLQEEDVYAGNNANSQALLRSTVNAYAANSNACRSTTTTYPACEVIVQSTKTTDDEQASSSTAPWVEHDYTYDDYSTSGGLVASGVYHNLTQEVISGSNLSTTLYPVTNKWTYTPNDQTVGSWTYYTVNAVTHRETDDHNGGVWQCQDTAYDEGSGNSKPTAGLPTTSTSYSTACQPGTAIKQYQGYDAYGNALAAVDGVGAANPAFYSSAGCAPTSGNTIVVHTSAWTNTHYTSCSNYDSTHFSALPVSTGNALGQSTSTAYDTTQGDAPTSTTDLNGQTTSYSYSYDSSGNRTVQTTKPLNSGSYTTQSKTNSSCTTSSTLPCYEIDTNTNQYSGAITRTFYDGMGRAVETRKPGPGATYDTIVFTVYNDQAHTSFQSVPFQVASGSGWVDPNGATDYQGTTPGGTVTFYDALGRAVAEQDPSYGSAQEPGLACSVHLSGTYTDCVNEWLDTAAGDTNTYASTTMVDANNHVTKSYADALGRTVYIQYYSGLHGQTLTSNEQKSTQYNALDKPTQVVVTDKAPQSGQGITSVTTTAQYDSLGRLTQVNDPDRGTHTYSYDADGRLLSDVVGSHTLGYNDDLLGRIGCVQDAVPTLNATGACSAGKTYVQNTYDTTRLGTQGSSDFPVGHLTQSVATTYYPEGTSATTTQKFQYDKRGRPITAQLSLGLPNAWNVTTALPAYQQATAYNDADQVTTTTTSTIPSGQGYTTTMAYDSSGAPYGLSNNSSSTPNLATLVYNARAQLDTINMQTSTGSALAAEQLSYDANLRVTSMTTSWQSGSGNTGTIFAENSSYDNASNVISLSTTQAAVPGFSGSGGSETQNFCYDEQNRLLWAGNSGTQPAAGNGTCGSGTLSSGLTGGSYSNSYVYTHLGQLWQGPLSGGSTQYQYLYCSNSQPHQLSGLYPLGTTCSNQSGAVYSSSNDALGNVTSRTYKGTTATLSYDNQDHLTEWNAGATSQEWYVYDGAGQRVLRRSTNGSTTSLTVYAFGQEEHSYTSTGSNQGNTYYYTLVGHLLGKSDGGSTTFYQTDLLDSVVADWSNTAGSAAIKGNEVYGPYGKQRYNQGTHGTPKGFTGQYNDTLTGLDYYNARYYDQVVGVTL